MHTLPETSSKAWLALLWAQYNKLSQPLKDGFFNLAQSMEKEVKGRNVSVEGVCTRINGQKGEKNGG